MNREVPSGHSGGVFYLYNKTDSLICYLIDTEQVVRLVYALCSQLSTLNPADSFFLFEVPSLARRTGLQSDVANRNSRPCQRVLLMSWVCF